MSDPSLKHIVYQAEKTLMKHAKDEINNPEKMIINLDTVYREKTKVKQYPYERNKNSDNTEMNTFVNDEMKKLKINTNNLIRFKEVNPAASLSQSQ
jgi:hypothetical protein